MRWPPVRHLLRPGSRGDDMSVVLVALSSALLLHQALCALAECQPHMQD